MKQFHTDYAGMNINQGLAKQCPSRKNEKKRNILSENDLCWFVKIFSELKRLSNKGYNYPDFRQEFFFCIKGH